MKNIIISFILILFSTALVHGQSAEPKVGDAITIDAKDGSKISGKVDKLTTKSIWIDSPAFGVIEFKRLNIEKMKIISGTAELDKKGYTIDNHGSTHYLVASSAFGLKKGEAYYENIMLFWNSVTFGITDNFSISTGGEILSLFGGQIPLIFVSPKFSFANDSYGGFSIGASFFSLPSQNFDGVGLAQATYTIGSRSNNFSIGAGYGFTFEEGFSDEVIPFNISFMTRLGKKISLVSENHVFLSDGEAYGLFSLSCRIHFDRQGTSLTAGLWRTDEDQEGLLALPFVSAIISF